jgi:hypothetical protein
MNTNISPFNVGFGVTVSGNVTYSVQHTFDDPGVGFTTWYSHPTIASKTDLSCDWDQAVSGFW